METKTRSKNAQGLSTKKMAELIDTLKFLGVMKNSIIGILLNIETDSQADELMMWMANNQEEAYQAKIIQKVHEINPNPSSRVKD